jgi:hypothetical protein
MTEKNKKTVVNLSIIYGLFALSLSVLLGIGFVQKVRIFSLSFSPLNVTTTGQVEPVTTRIHFSEINDEIILPSLKSGKLSYEISVVGVFVVDQPFQEGEPLWIGCDYKNISETQQVLLGSCIWNQADVFRIKLHNFVTMNEDLIPLGVTISQIIITHTYL